MYRLKELLTLILLQPARIPCVDHPRQARIKELASMLKKEFDV